MTPETVSAYVAAIVAGVLAGITAYQSWKAKRHAKEAENSYAKINGKAERLDKVEAQVKALQVSDELLRQLVVSAISTTELLRQIENHLDRLEYSALNKTDRT